MHAEARGESLVKRTILLLLTVAACRSASTPSPVDRFTLPGRASPRTFLAPPRPDKPSSGSSGQRRVQDLQEMSIAWGTSKGPARDQFERTELEKRLIVMQGCYDSDKHRIVDEQPG